jgi:hypothetical protein
VHGNNDILLGGLFKYVMRSADARQNPTALFKHLLDDRKSHGTGHRTSGNPGLLARELRCA